MALSGSAGISTPGLGRTALVALGTLVALLAGPGSAQSASRDLRIGFADDIYLAPDPQVRDLWFDSSVDAGAEIVRLGVSWRQIVVGEPEHPRDPADPGYGFYGLDQAVIDASQRGLDVLLTIYNAPNWAEGRGRPDWARAGTWKPRARALANFAHAAAERYSGSFMGLPRVRFYQAWNEPNLDTYLTPQYKGKNPRSPAIYRGLLNAFYHGVNGVHRGNVVISGGTAPWGDRRGGDRVRPLLFLRKLFCLHGRRGLNPRPCPETTHLDVLAHHPISVNPRRSAQHPDDATVADFHSVGRVLRAAEGAGRVLPAKRHQLWATELWWESDPPDKFFGLPLRRQARWLELGLYLLWKQGARVALNLPIRDQDYQPETAGYTLQSGVFFSDADKKPSFRAFRFPFVAHRRGPSTVVVWGKAPQRGRLEIQRKVVGGWWTVKAVHVRKGQVFTPRVRLKGALKLRGSIEGRRSLLWPVRG